MWAFLSLIWAEYPIFVIILLILIIIGVVITSVHGKLIWETKLGRLGIGGMKKRNRRACFDCYHIIISKKEKFQSFVEILENRILKDQMNFLEQKLIQITNMLSMSYRVDITKFRSDEPNVQEEHKQYILYREALKNALMIAKDEIRRSFKENGFLELSGNEFTSYVKGKTQILISMVREYIVNHYPYSGMIVDLDARFANFDKNTLEDMVFEIFNNAKDVKSIALHKIEKLTADYETEMDNFLSEMEKCS